MKLKIILLLLLLSQISKAADKVPGDTTGQQLRVVLQTGHSEKCDAFFTADDEHFFTYTSGGEIFEWETGSLRQIRNYLGHQGALSYCRLSGQQLLTVSDNRCFFWTRGHTEMEKSLLLFDSTGDYRCSVYSTMPYNDHFLLLQQYIKLPLEDREYKVSWQIDLQNRTRTRLPDNFMNTVFYVHPSLPLIITVEENKDGFTIALKRETTVNKRQEWQTIWSKDIPSTKKEELSFDDKLCLSPDGQWIFYNRSATPTGTDTKNLEKTLVYAAENEKNIDPALEELYQVIPMGEKMLVCRADKQGKLKWQLLSKQGAVFQQEDSLTTARYLSAEGRKLNPESDGEDDQTVIIDHTYRKILRLKKDKFSLSDWNDRSLRFSSFRVAVPSRIIPSADPDAFVIVNGTYKPSYWFWKLGNSFPEAIYDPQSPLIDSTLLIRLADTSGNKLKYKIDIGSQSKMSYFRGLQTITLTDANGKITELSGHTGDLGAWCIDSSQRWLASSSRAEVNSALFNEIKFWNIEKAYEYKRMLDVEPDAEIDQLRLSLDGKYLWGSYAKKLLVKWELKTGVPQKQWNIFAPFGMSPNDSLLAGATDLGQDILVYEQGGGRLVYTLKGHSSSLTDLHFINGGKFLVSSSRDGKVMIWNMADGSRLYDIIQLNDGFSYILMTGNNYYLGSREALNELNFVWKEQAWSYEPFDLALNRPDIVLGRIGQEGSANYLPALREAWRKRVVRAGRKPEEAAQIPGIDQLPSVTVMKEDWKEGELLLKTKLSAGNAGAKLFDYQVRINGVPVHSQGTHSWSGKETSIEVIDSIQLLEPLNIVQLYCRDEQKRESPRKTLVYELPSAAKQGKRIFVGIGVSAYKEEQYRLRYPVKDVKDLSLGFLRNDNKGDRAYLLLDGKASHDSILALKKILATLKEEDELIISFNGHGVVDSSLEFYFAPYDMQFTDPSKKGISFEEINELLRSAPARKKLCLIDACHSGALDQEEKYTIVKDAVALGGQRGAVITTSSGANSGSTNSFRLMQHLFTDLSDNDGSIIISAASGDEVAFEGDTWKNGAFTYCVRNGLEKKEADQNRDGHVSVSELKNYVSRLVQLITEGRQQPMSRQDNTRLVWEMN